MAALREFLGEQSGELFAPPNPPARPAEAADHQPYPGLTPEGVARVLSLAITRDPSDLLSLRLLRAIEMKPRRQTWLTRPVTRLSQRTGVF